MRSSRHSGNDDAHIPPPNLIEVRDTWADLLHDRREGFEDIPRPPDAAIVEAALACIFRKAPLGGGLSQGSHKFFGTWWCF